MNIYFFVVTFKVALKPDELDFVKRMILDDGYEIVDVVNLDDQSSPPSIAIIADE